MGRDLIIARNTKDTRHMDPRNPCDSTQRFSPIEDEEIGYRNTTTRRSSVYSNTNAGGRGAQTEKNCSKQKTRQDEAHCSQTATLVGEELKPKRTARNKRHDKRSSVYSNTNAGGRGA